MQYANSYIKMRKSLKSTHLIVCLNAVSEELTREARAPCQNCHISSRPWFGLLHGKIKSHKHNKFEWRSVSSLNFRTAPM